MKIIDIMLTNALNSSNSFSPSLLPQKKTGLFIVFKYPLRLLYFFLHLQVEQNFYLTQENNFAFSFTAQSIYVVYILLLLFS